MGWTAYVLKNGLKGILEGKDYKALDTVLTFDAAFIDRCTAFEESAPFTKVHTMYSEFTCEVTGER